MLDNRYQAIVDRYADRYAGVVDRDELTALVEQSRQDLEPNSKIPDFLPILVERFVRERLVHLAEEKGVDQHGVRDILFVCEGNTGRSQMAAAFANQMAQGRLRAWSAGVNPIGEIPNDVNEAMRERGVDMSESYAKPVTGDATRAAEFLVSIGVPSDQLPVHGRRTIEWEIGPVVGTSGANIRAIRDELERRVRELVTEILA